jgi:MerR, DNA binding
MASLDETGVLLEALYAPAPPAATWRAMGEAKLAELDALIARLHQMRGLLSEALVQCHLDPDRRQIIATALDWPAPCHARGWMLSLAATATRWRSGAVTRRPQARTPGGHPH